MNFINWKNIEVLIDEVDNPKGNILFLHGFTGNFNNKLSFRNFFTEYNFYGINMPGHGNSKYENINELNTNNFLNIIVEFIKKNNLDNLIVLGHSMGGGLAIMLNSVLTEKIKILVLEAPANKSVFENYNIVQKMIPSDIEETKFVLSKLVFEPIKFFGGEKNFNFFIKKEFNELNSKYKDLKIMLNMEVMNEFFNRIQSGIKKINKPTILFIGDKDEIVPFKSTINNFKSNIQNKYLKIIECKNCAHLPLSENKNNLVILKQIIESLLN